MEAIRADKTSNAITRAQFADAITRTVNNRSRAYKNCFARSIRWELDNTIASADSENSQTILSTLNLDQAELVILAEQDQTPQWTLNDRIRPIFQVTGDTPGKSIVRVHYARHGDVRGEELFTVEGPSH